MRPEGTGLAIEPGLPGEEQQHHERIRRRPFADLARRVAIMVGDGCIVRVADGAGGLAAVGAADRDAARQRVLSRQLAAPPLPIADGWIGQALERRCVLRVPEIGDEDLAEAGLPADQNIGDVIVVPVTGVEAVIVAIRDRASEPFSFAERIALERIAAEQAEASEEDGAAGPLSPDETARLLELTSVGLWVVDLEGLTVWVNEAASELVGVPGRELAGRPVPGFLGGAAEQIGADLHAEQRSDRKLTRPDGSTVWLSCVGRTLFDRAGALSGTLLTLSEISDRKNREVELRMRLEIKDALISLAEHSLDAPDLRAILSQSVGVLGDQLDADLALAGTIDLAARTLRPSAACGGEGAIDLDGTLEIAPRCITMTAAEEGEPVIVGDFERERLFERSTFMSDLGIRSGICLPFGDGSGVLSAFSSRADALGREQLPLLRSVARMIANYQALIEEMQRIHGIADRGGRVASAPPCEPARPTRMRRRR